MSPTARTLASLRRDGLTAGVVERWLPHVNRRSDFLGVIDIIAVGPGVTMGIQATSASNVSSRLAKARASTELRAWLTAGNAFEVWGWAKRGPRWHVRKVQLLPEDLAAVEVQALPRRWRARRGERQGELFG